MNREYRRISKVFERERRVNCLAKPGVHQLIMVLDHLKRDFNIGKIIRSSEAFGVRAVYLIGVPFFDPTPAKGSFKHVPVRFFDNFAECFLALQEQGYTTYVMDLVDSKPLGGFSFPEKTALVVGHEEFGLSFDRSVYPEIQVIRIPQFGKVESLNVSVAASIAMFEYTRQWSKPDDYRPN